MFDFPSIRAFAMMTIALAVVCAVFGVGRRWVILLGAVMAVISAGIATWGEVVEQTLLSAPKGGGCGGSGLIDAFFIIGGRFVAAGPAAMGLSLLFLGLVIGSPKAPETLATTSGSLSTKAAEALEEPRDDD